MSMKSIFTFMNFQNVYWHGKTHSALWQELHILAEHKSFYEADNKSWSLFVLYLLHIQVTIIMYTNLILVGEEFSTSNFCLFVNITNYPTALSVNQSHCFRQIFLPAKTDLHMCCHKPRDLTNMNASDYRYIGLIRLTGFPSSKHDNLTDMPVI